MNVTLLLEQAEVAERAGFAKVASDLKSQADRAKRLAVAYEHYRYVSAEAVEKFNATLKAKTSRAPTLEETERFYLNRYQVTSIHDRLAFVAMAEYPGLPPAEVLGKVIEAQGRACFDRFEVAEIVPEATHVKLPDPIVFGVIEGCTDRFFIAEWGEDVSIKDLIPANAG